MGQYGRMRDAGRLRKITRGPRKGQQKTLDEVALQRSIDKAAGIRPQQEADLARVDAVRELDAALPETDKRLLSIIAMMDRARTGL